MRFWILLRNVFYYYCVIAYLGTQLRIVTYPANKIFRAFNQINPLNFVSLEGKVISYTVARAIISRGLYIFYSIFHYIVKRLALKTIYVLYKEILQFLSLKSAVYSRERVIIAWSLFYFLSKKSIKFKFSKKNTKMQRNFPVDLKFI